MRKDAALRYLEQRSGTWVQVTQPETLDAIRDLRDDGHRIVLRHHDEGVDQEGNPLEPGWEVKYTAPEHTLADLAAQVFGDDVVAKPPGCTHPSESWRETESGTVCTDCGEVIHAKPLTPGMAGRPNPLVHVVDEATGKERYVVAEQTCEECGEPYVIKAQHERFSSRHKQWVKGHLEHPEIAVPQQDPTWMFPEDFDLSGIVFGETVICPRCKGTRIRRKGVVDAVCMEHDGKHKCIRCNGHGLIPNMGPVSGGTFSLGTKEFRSDA